MDDGTNLLESREGGDGETAAPAAAATGRSASYCAVDGMSSASPAAGDEGAAAAAAPHSQSEWRFTALLLVADIIGTGILSLPGAVNELGSALGLTWLCLALPLNVGSGMLLYRARMDCAAATGVKPTTYGEAFSALYGPNHPLCGLSYAILYSYIVFVLGDYLIVLAKSVQAAFYGVVICRPVAAAVSCVALLPLAQLRTLHAVSWSSIVGTSTILIALGICFNDVAMSGPAETAMPAVAPLGFIPTTSTMSGFLFTCGGQKIYLEMMAEMRQPSDFPRALAAAMFVIGTSYVAITVICVRHLGAETPDYILDVLGYGSTRVVANIMLFVHMLVSYTVSQQVVSRAIHRLASPKRVNAYGWLSQGHFEWTAVTLAVMMTAFLLAETIPRFIDLINLMGSLFASVLSFVFPVMLFARAHSLRTKRRRSVALNGVLAGYLVLSAYFILVGTFASLRRIVDHSADGSAAPFSCLCEAERCAPLSDDE